MKLTNGEEKLKNLENILKNDANKLESKTIRKAFDDLVLSTSCHGIPNLFRTDSALLRIIWIIFLIVSTGACGWMITKSVKDFFEYDIITKIEIKQENEMTLPAMTLCVERKCYNDNYSPREIYALTCEFNVNSSCINNFQYNNYHDQTCITFNSFKLNSNDYLKSLKSGKRFGIIMAVFLPYNTFVNIFISDNQVKPGFNQLENFNGAVLSETNFKIKKYVDKKLPSPYNKCVATSDSPLYKEIVESNTTYTQEYCLTLRLQIFHPSMQLFVSNCL